MYGYKRSVQILAPYEMGLYDNSGLTALMHAVRSDKYGVIPILIKEVMIVDNSGNSALHHAC